MPEHHEPVVVTGIGILTCLGRGLEAHRLALHSQPAALGPISLFAVPSLNGSPVGEVPAAALAGVPSRPSRVEQLGLAAARDALGSFAPQGPGLIVVGTTTGSILESEVAWAEARATPGGEPLRRMRHHPMGETAFALAGDLGLQAECHTFATACSSSSNAIGYGAIRIRRGAQWALVGGVDTLCRMTYSGFHALRLLSRGAPRPFDAQRSGVAVSEAAAFLLIEPESLARARGAKIYGEIAGWGCAVDAFHQTAPDPKGTGMIAAMRGALAEAGVEPSDVGYINAHGTATEANDRVESLAIDAVFGPAAKAPWVSSTKGLTGHCLGAAGAVEAALCLAALAEHRAPETTGLGTPDAVCSVHHVPRGGAPISGELVISNSFGFGGNNATLALKAPRASGGRPISRPPPRAPKTFVHGVGIVAPGAAGVEALWARLSAPPRPDAVPDEAAVVASRNAAARPVRLERMAIAAAREALGAHSALGTALVVGTCYGRIHAPADFLEGLAQRGPEHGSPFTFYQSVYHALAGHLGIQLGMKGVGMTTSAREVTAESALRVGLDLLSEGRVERVLVVASDDAVPALADVLPPAHPVRAGWESFGPAAGAAAVLLSREPSQLELKACELVNHPARTDALATPEQWRPLVARALEGAGEETLFSSFLGERGADAVTPLDDHLRIGLNPSGGLLRLAAALVRLSRGGPASRAVVHGLALGGGQALCIAERA